MRVFRHGARRPGLACLVVAIFLTACVGGGEEGESSGDALRVVVVSDQTGSLASSLGTAAAGFRTRAEEINEEGGVDGRMLDVQIIDSRSDANAGAGVFRDALSQEPDVLMVSGLSSTLAGVADLVAAEPVPLLTITAPDSLLYPPQENVFMFGPTARENGVGLVNMAKQLADGDLSGTRVGVISFQSAYTDALLQAIEDSAQEEGFEIVANESIELGTASASSQASAIAGADPDFVLMGISGGDAPTVFNDLTTAGIDVPVVAYTAASAPAILERFTAPNYYAAREAQFPGEVESVIEAARAAGTEDQAQSSFYTDGWIMADAVAEALERCEGTCGGEALRETFADFGTYENELAFGPFELSEDNHAGTTALQFFVWDDAEGTAVPAGDPVEVG